MTAAKKKPSKKVSDKNKVTPEVDDVLVTTGDVPAEATPAEPQFAMRTMVGFSQDVEGAVLWFDISRPEDILAYLEQLPMNVERTITKQEHLHLAPTKAIE